MIHVSLRNARRECACRKDNLESAFRKASFDNEILVYDLYFLIESSRSLTKLLLVSQIVIHSQIGSFPSLAIDVNPNRNKDIPTADGCL